MNCKLASLAKVLMFSTALYFFAIAIGGCHQSPSKPSVDSSFECLHDGLSRFENVQILPVVSENSEKHHTEKTARWIIIGAVGSEEELRDLWRIIQQSELHGSIDMDVGIGKIDEAPILEWGPWQVESFKRDEGGGGIH